MSYERWQGQDHQTLLCTKDPTDRNLVELQVSLVSRKEFCQGEVQISDLY